MSDALTSDGTFSHAAARIAALRRVSGAEVVDEGIQLARQNYGALIMAALLPLLPYLGMRVWISTHSLGVWGTLLVIPFNAVWASLAGAAAARVAMDALEGSPPDPARGLGVALRRAWPVVLSGLCRAMLTLLGFVLLVIPGFYVVSIYALLPALPVLEARASGWQALRRSATLTRGARLLAFGAYIVPCYFAAGANVVLSMLTSRAIGPGVGQVLGALVGGGVLLTLLPFLAAIQVRLYVELRMRKEAIDIEWALASMSAAPVT
jgi:hypothetical protein